MLTETLKVTFSATFQLLLMGLVGYVFAKKKVIDDAGARLLTTLVVRLFLPMLIFTKLTQNFSFDRYDTWWMFPLMYVGLVIASYVISRGIFFFNKGCQYKNEFSALFIFQNAGFVPLLLVTTLFSGEIKETLFVYIFLFCMGFDASIWTAGVSLVTGKRVSFKNYKTFLNPPLITVICTLILIALKWHVHLPRMITAPVAMFSDCALPMSIILVGANLGHTDLSQVNKRDIGIFLLFRLVLIPMVAIAIVTKFNVGYILGLFIVMQTAMPSAVSLSIVARNYNIKTPFINQGVLIGNLVSILTIPIIMTAYNYFVLGK